MKAAPEASESGGNMTVIEHLTELRTRVVRSAIAIAIGAVVGWFVYEDVLHFILQPYCDSQGVADCTLRVDEPLEALSTRMMVAGYVGVALAIPVWLWQAWRFISPGLYPHEKRHGTYFVMIGVALFAMGASLAFWTLPRALSFLIEIGGDGLTTEFRAKAYVEFIIKMTMAFGLGFEFPLLLVFLQILGIVDHKMLGRQRRYAIVGIVVLVAVITPSGDPISLLALAGPMYLFYELSILFGRLRGRRKARSAAT